MELQKQEQVTSRENWKTGSFNKISFDDILAKLLILQKEPNHLIIIGSDSHYRKNYTVFATAITIVNPSGKMHSLYFYNKSIITIKNKFGDLFYRLYQEMQESLSVANEIRNSLPNVNIEVHLDVSSSSKNKTYKFSNGIKEIVTSQGYPVKIKPNAWGATAVADKHTKHVTRYVSL